MDKALALPRRKLTPRAERRQAVAAGKPERYRSGGKKRGFFARDEVKRTFVATRRQERIADARPHCWHPFRSPDGRRL